MVSKKGGRQHRAIKREAVQGSRFNSRDLSDYASHTCDYRPGWLGVESSVKTFEGVLSISPSWKKKF